MTDLGQGLSYLRVHSVADSETALHQILPGPGALVLDLRYATASEESAAALQSLLARRPATAPLYVLVSPATPPAVARALGPAALTLGVAGSHPAPRVAVKTDATADRRAYDAFDAGTPVDKLISGKVEKERFDEAALVHEFKDGDHDAEPPDLPDPTTAKSGETADGAKPDAPADDRLLDRVLQRAVNLHHALLALRPGG